MILGTSEEAEEPMDHDEVATGEGAGAIVPIEGNFSGR